MDRFAASPLSRLCALAVCVMMLISAFGMFAKAYACMDAMRPARQTVAVVTAADTPNITAQPQPTQTPPVFAITCTPVETQRRYRVLIYHTHTYEAYLPDADNPYALSGGSDRRTQDETQNVVAVGARLAQQLETLGIEAVHDKTAFEPPKFGTAYLRSLDMLQERLENGETYDLIIDLHRDTYYAQLWTPAAVTINGTESARILFLIGDGEAGFSQKPNWQANKQKADAIALELTQINPQLCVDVLVKDQRYNQHVSENAVLIEMGHCDNTLDSVLTSADYLAQAIARSLKGN